MQKLHTEIDVDASPQAVWKILMDFAAYPEWNPFVVSIAGRAELGAGLEVRLQPEGGRAFNIRPVATALEPNRYFEWLGSLGMKSLFSGRHQFAIETTSDGTRFIQSEEFTGVLVPLLHRSLKGGTRRGFEAMNLAIKKRAEEESSGRD